MKTADPPLCRRLEKHRIPHKKRRDNFTGRQIYRVIKRCDTEDHAVSHPLDHRDMTFVVPGKIIAAYGLSVYGLHLIGKIIRKLCGADDLTFSFPRAFPDFANHKGRQIFFIVMYPIGDQMHKFNALVKRRRFPRGLCGF